MSEGYVDKSRGVVDVKRRPTINDVALAAGVSISTVSRALNNPARSRPTETTLRVKRVAAELGYTPDAAASQLRRGATDTIGVLVARLHDTVMAMLFEQIAAACARRNYFAVVAATLDDPGTQERAGESLLRRGIDGLILCTARENDPFLRTLRERGVRHALALRPDGSSPAAIGDDELGGFLAGRHLVDLGHRRIAVASGPSYALSARRRQQGFFRALGVPEGEIDPNLIYEGDFSLESGERAAQQFFGLQDAPTAIFAANDNMAIGIMSAAHRMGIYPPRDFSIVGYNDIPLAERLWVPLTSVRIPLNQIAADAVSLLLDTPPGGLADGPLQLKSTPALIPRASTIRYPAG